MLLGLVTPTSGVATIGGVRYRDLLSPLSSVGSALEAASFHPGRTARDHLGVYAKAARIDPKRVPIVLDTVGLSAHGTRRVGGYSLGMRQRLGLAFALLGDPGVLVLDEPINGLDPEGIKWIRGFLRQLAAEGRTVLISSHLLSEVQQSVDEVVIIARGTLVHRGPLSSLEVEGAATKVIVDSPNREQLIAALTAASATFEVARAGILVSGLEPGHIGHIAFAAGVEVSSLHRQKSGLEDSFLALVGEGGSL
jgi:ABC-2 type transport system ATP-binding protein